MVLKTLWAVLSLTFCACIHGVETNTTMRTILKESFSGITEPRQLVITNRADWEKLWNEHTSRTQPRKPAPEVDFAQESIVVAALGQKRSGGHSIEITSVRALGGKAVVQTKTHAPEPGALTIQALTSPIHIVAVPKISGVVEFKVE